MPKMTLEERISEMKKKREAILTPRNTKPEFYFLYWNKEVSGQEIYQDSVYADSEEDARIHFAKCYNATLLEIRKDEAFTAREIKATQKKYSK